MGRAYVDPCYLRNAICVYYFILRDRRNILLALYIPCGWLILKNKKKNFFELFIKFFNEQNSIKLRGQSEYLGLCLDTSSLVLLCVSDKLIVYQFKALLILSVYQFKALLNLSSLVFIRKLDILFLTWNTLYVF